MHILANYQPLAAAYKEISNNREFIMELLTINPGDIEYIGDGLKDDEEVVLVAVRQEGRLLQYVFDRLKDNDSVVNAAVSQNPHVIKYASWRLREILEEEDDDDFDLYEYQQKSVYEV